MLSPNRPHEHDPETGIAVPFPISHLAKHIMPISRLWDRNHTAPSLSNAFHKQESISKSFATEKSLNSDPGIKLLDSFLVQYTM